MLFIFHYSTVLAIEYSFIIHTYILTFKIPFSSIHSFTFAGTLSFDDDMGKRKGIK